MKRHLLLLLALLVSAALFTLPGCDKKETPAGEPTMGTITGKVVAMNGTTPIPMATVFVDADGEIYLTYTNLQGDFNLEVPSGTHPLYIESGKGNIFRSMTTITVPESKTVSVPDGQIKLAQVGALAYIAGAFDNIQDIIINDLGYTATELTVADLDNYNTLNNFDGIFFNCGKSDPLNGNKYQNLLTYVNSGGSVYASDWAVEYLTGDGNAKSHQDHILLPSQKTGCTPEVGGFIDDSLLCSDKLGPMTTIVAANILPADIQAYMGLSTIDVEYDLGGWETILELATPPWEVIIQDATTYGPLAVRMTFPGSSKSSREKQEWVTICHIPPGNPNNPQTITIAASALPAHMAHGDYIGSCSGNGGTVYFTTFHNHAQGTISPNMKKMLQYFILNL